jgi:hypothetical protein
MKPSPPAYENECGAIAADGNIVTWGTAFLNAEQRAMLECKKPAAKIAR